MGLMHDRMKTDLTLKNYAAGTVTQYLACARRFAETMGNPLDVGEEAIRKYVVEFAEGRSPSTVKMHVAGIRFLYEVTLRLPERVTCLFYPKVPRTLPDILSLDEVLGLLKAVTSPKHRMVLMTAYGAGMRIREACTLMTTDIDRARGVIHLRHCKRGRDRVAMLSRNLLAALEAYWRLCRPKAPIMFPGKQPGTCVTPEAVRASLREAVVATGITKRVTPHSLRHACATHLHEDGVDIRTIQALLGHTSIRSTGLYTHVSTAHIAKIKSPLDKVAVEELPAP